MKNFLIFVGGCLVGAYGMYSHTIAMAAKAIIDENKKNAETTND